MIPTSMSTRSKVTLSLGVFLLVLLLGLIDYLTGSEIAFSVFYLFPVGLAAWYVGRRVAIACSAASTFTWYLADTLARTQPYSHPFIPVWNSTTRLAVFLVVSVLLAALHEALERESQFARMDYLTGAANSRAFYEAAAVRIANLKRYGRPFTTLYLDADDLKEVNDRFGHSAGDEVLRAAAAAIRKRLRAGDTVARMGGDEFAVLLGEANEEAARVVAPRIQSALRESVSKRWPVTFSIGVLTCAGVPQSIDELVEGADDLMYAVKMSGKDAIRYGVVAGETRGSAMARHKA